MSRACSDCAEERAALRQIVVAIMTLITGVP